MRWKVGASCRGEHENGGQAFEVDRTFGWWEGVSSFRRGSEIGGQAYKTDKQN